ncbi:MAG: serine hydrolase domain-containing protein [Chloroflexota bacterium]
MPAQENSVAFPIPQFVDPNRREKLASAFPQVARLFQEFATQKRTPGLAFGVVLDGELVYAGGVGVQNTSTKEVVTPDSIFRIASMTKSFTAMSVVKLRDEGKLRLDDPVADYVPELAALRYPTRDSAPITIRQLLTMSEGFPQDDPWADRQLGASEDQLSAWLDEGISFSNPPGITFEYSNFGYAILGRVVTNVSGMPYQGYAKRNILDPLGMSSSTYDVSMAPPERLAMGYRLEENEWVEEPPLSDGTFGAMGGLFTTITDFARYMAFLLAAFPPRNEPENGPIRRSSAREMQQAWRHRSLTTLRPTPDAATVVQSDGYGYGLVSSTESLFGYSVAHGGGLPGYGTFYRLLPDYGIGIVAFTNLTYISVSPRITEVLTALHKTGSLKPRVLPIAPTLLAARASIMRLYEQWDEAEVSALATESFFQDMPIAKRQAQFERLRADLGACLSATDLQPENALRGEWTMHCERGWLNVFMTLAPTVPPRLQFLELTAAKPLSEAMQKFALQLARLINTWDEAEFQALFAPQVILSQMQPQLEALRVQYGSLTLGDVLEGDGETVASVRFESERSALEVRLVRDAESDKLREVTFARPQTLAFVP